MQLKLRFIFFCLFSFLYSISVWAQPALQLDSNLIRTIAGAGVAGNINALGTLARLNEPTGVCIDTAGNIYIADFANHSIRKVDPITGQVTLLAGSGVAGYADGLGAAASFNSPTGLVCDIAGNVYVADQFNLRIRKITPAGLVTTFAGTGNVGTVNGPALNADFTFPCGITLDVNGNFYVADQYSHVIRKISNTGMVTVFAGTPNAPGFVNGADSNARFNTPTGLTVDLNGNVYVADNKNNCIRKITPAGFVSTFAGSGAAGYADGTGTNAAFTGPSAVFADALGNVYVSDKNNQRIRKIAANGMVSTVLGDGIYQGLTGNGIKGRVGNPYGLCLDKQGRLLVVETGFHILRRTAHTQLDTFVTKIAEPSSVGSFSFTGYQLNSNVQLVASTGFQISLNSDFGFTDTLNLSLVNNQVNQTIYVRCFTTSQGGIFNGSVSITSTGANTILVPLVASVTCNGITFQPNYVRDAVAGVPYSFQLSAPQLSQLNWSLAAGTLPNGLSIHPTNGTISGTPNQTGNYFFTIQGMASASCLVQQNYQMLVVNTALPRYGFFQNDCSNRNIQFYDSSLMATSHFWDFGDGTTSTLANPLKTYARDSVYLVTLTINGSIAFSRNIFVFSTPSAPVITSTTDCNNLYSFNGAPTGSYHTYQWVFNGGLPGSASNVRVATRRYLTTDTAQAYVVVSSGNRCSAVSNVLRFKPTLYAPNVVAGIAISAPGNNFCSNNRIVSNTSSIGLASYTVSVNGGPFLPITSSINLNGLSKGTYTIRLAAHNGICFDTATSTFVISTVTAAFTDQPSTCNASVQFTNTSFSEEPQAMNYKWYFGSPVKDSSVFINPLFNFGSGGVDTVTLIVSGANGCVSTVKRAINVNAGTTPNPSFTWQANAPCNNRIQFTNTSSNGASSYLWSFGDSTFSTAISPAKSYADTGNYQVILYAFNGTCQTAILQTIRVDSGAVGPYAAFSVNQANQLFSTQSFNFNNTSKHLGAGFNSSYQWEFGDGLFSSNTFVFNKVYHDTGNYWVRLVATNNLGCRDTTYKSVRVEPIEFARFGYVAPGCTSRAVQFLDSSYLANTWYWEFGDGDTSTQRNPMHTYLKDSTYLVRLTINGTKTFTRSINILNQAPVTSIGYTVNCAYEYTFSGAPLGNGYTYHWQFSGGTGSDTTLRIPTRNYTTPGLTSVDLTVYNQGQCPASASQLIFTPTILQNGFTTKAVVYAPDSNLCATTRIIRNDGAGATLYQWRLDNGAFDTLFAFETLSGLSPGPHSVEVVGSKGFCSDTLRFNFIISSPIASFIAIPSTCNQQVNFLSTSTSTDNGLLQHQWLFGKPLKGTANTQNASFNFGVAGADSATLVLTSSSGCSLSLSKGFVVGNGTGPNASFNHAISNATCKNIIQFTNTTAGSGHTYTWDFGDGSSSNLANPIHGFAASVNFTVQLTVSNGSCASTATKIIQIDSGAFGPVARFGSNQTSMPIDNHSFTFMNQSTHLGSSAWNVKYRWSTGDGFVDSISNSLYNKKYAAPGTYLVSLSAINNVGCVDTYTSFINVYPVLEAKFGYIENACNSRLVQFFDSSSLASTYKWYFGDGDSSSLKSPSHTYAKDSLYKVVLIVNASDTFERLVAVATTPVVGSLSFSRACDNIYTFYGAPLGYTYNYFWGFGGDSTGTDTFVRMPSRAYATAGIKEVTLQVRSYNRCPANATPLSFNAAVFVQSAKAKFEVVPPVGQTFCSNNRVINNLSNPGLLSYTYSLNGGPFNALGSSAAINNLSPGYHLIRMAVYNGNCTDTVADVINISVPVPDFDFTASNCNQLISFTNQSTTNDLAGMTYAWQFGTPLKGGSNATNPVFNFLTPGVDTVVLTTTSQSGCAVSIKKAVVAGFGSTQLPLDFSYNIAPNSCSNRIKFNNLSPIDTAMRYTWNFPDGTSDIRLSPIKTFSDTGDLNVILIGNKNGCFSTLTKTVNLPFGSFGPIASFMPNNPVQDFVGHSFNFLNNSSSLGLGWVVSNRWHFGDGNIDSVNTFIFNRKYANPGKYEVMLAVVGSTGCRDTAYRSIEVLPVPVAKFSFNGLNCNNRTVQFIDSSVLATSYQWRFGDGNSSTAASPAHTYAVDGIYKVTLIINNLDSISKNVEVINSPASSFLVQANTCKNVFTLTPLANGNDYTYRWLGDRRYWTDSSEQVQRISFDKTDTGYVQLLVTKKGVCSSLSSIDTIYGFNGPKADFSIGIADSCSDGRLLINQSSGMLASYYILDNNLPQSIGSMQAINGLSAGLHTIKMVAVESLCSDTFSRSFVVSDVTGDFIAEQLPCVKTVAFEPNISFENSLTAKYVWNFGDGNTTDTAIIKHTYANGGLIPVSLEVSLSNGCRRIFAKDVNVINQSGPGAAIAYTLQTGAPCNTGYRFNAISTNAVEYLWDYGDGFKSPLLNSNNVFHAYAFTGNYPVVLAAIDAKGCSSISDTLFLQVNNPGKARPVARFVTQDTVKCFLTQKFDFVNATYMSGAGFVNATRWNLGDGTIDVLNSSIYGKNYASIGNYRVSLTSTSDAGCIDSFSMVVRVVDDSICNPNPVGLGVSSLKHLIKLYPNPNAGSFYIQSLQELGTCELNVYDIAGRLVWEGSRYFGLNQSQQLELGIIKAGNYILTIQNREGQIQRMKFVVYDHP
jgi:PKD repeat protein/sugar lactone lactonase YvrE